MTNIRVGDIVQYVDDWESQIYWGRHIKGLSLVKFRVSEWDLEDHDRALRRMRTRGIIVRDPSNVFGVGAEGLEVPLYYYGTNLRVIQRALKGRERISRRLTVVRGNDYENQERET